MLRTLKTAPVPRSLIDSAARRPAFRAIVTRCGGDAAPPCLSLYPERKSRDAFPCRGMPPRRRATRGRNRQSVPAFGRVPLWNSPACVLDVFIAGVTPAGCTVAGPVPARRGNQRDSKRSAAARTPRSPSDCRPARDGRRRRWDNKACLHPRWHVYSIFPSWSR